MRRSMLSSGIVLAFAASLSPGSFASAPNLVTNGNFEAGNTGFSSDYAYSPAGNTDEGQYTVRSNPFPWNGQFISGGDHTTGSGQMYVGNGSPVDGAVVWESTTIAVAPNTDYFFEAYVTDVCCSSAFPGNTPSILEFSVSGDSLGTATTNLALAGTWQGLSKEWNSGSSTSVTLSLINRNTARAGNDFAIDDIYLGTESTVITSAPEPGSYALMLVGVGMLAALRRRASGAGRG